jgi:hypothetical protein
MIIKKTKKHVSYKLMILTKWRNTCKINGLNKKKVERKQIKTNNHNKNEEIHVKLMILTKILLENIL